MTRSYVGHDSFMRGTWRWLLHCSSGKTRLYVGHDSFLRGRWSVCTWDTIRFMCGTWPFHSCVGREGDFELLDLKDSFARERWFVHVWNLTPSLFDVYAPFHFSSVQTFLYMGNDSFIGGTWLLQIFDVNAPFPFLEWKDSFICGTWLVHAHVWNMTTFRRLKWMHLCIARMERLFTSVTGKTVSHIWHDLIIWIEIGTANCR